MKKREYYKKIFGEERQHLSIRLQEFKELRTQRESRPDESPSPAVKQPGADSVRKRIERARERLTKAAGAGENASFSFCRGQQQHDNWQAGCRIIAGAMKRRIAGNFTRIMANLLLAGSEGPQSDGKFVDNGYY